MQTRTIPKDTYPWWECKINHRKFRYPAGETVPVPDEVAAMIDEINAAAKRPDAPYLPRLPDITAADDGKVLRAVGGKWVLTDSSELPVVSPEDENKTVQVVGGAWTATDVLLNTEGTIGSNGDKVPTVTLDVDAETLYNAVAAGKTVAINTVYEAEEEGEPDVPVTWLVHMACLKATVGSADFYDFSYFNSDGLEYAVDGLAADDVVVLTKKE